MTESRRVRAPALACKGKLATAHRDSSVTVTSGPIGAKRATQKQNRPDFRGLARSGLFRFRAFSASISPGSAHAVSVPRLVGYLDFRRDLSRRSARSPRSHPTTKTSATGIHSAGMSWKPMMNNKPSLRKTRLPHRSLNLRNPFTYSQPRASSRARSSSARALACSASGNSSARMMSSPMRSPSACSGTARSRSDRRRVEQAGAGADDGFGGGLSPHRRLRASPGCEARAVRQAGTRSPLSAGNPASGHCARAPSGRGASRGLPARQPTRPSGAIYLRLRSGPHDRSVACRRWWQHSTRTYDT